MDNKIELLIKVMKKLQTSAYSKRTPEVSPDVARAGLDLSARVCAQPETVVATPLMKNLLVAFGDVDQHQDPETGEWSTDKLPTGKESKAVAWINEVVQRCLAKFNGAEAHDYPDDLPIDNIRYYDIDCWNGWKDKVWDIQPGQADERKKRFLEYGSPKTNASVDYVAKLLASDDVLRKAVLTEMDLIPTVTASQDVNAISDPFMSKGTGVSYPFYRNDRTVVPGSKETYGQYTIRLVEEANRKGWDSLKELALQNSVYTGYPRNQRGKGRALIAQSRLTNLVINMVNGPEMELWKANTFEGIAFQDEETIRRELSKLLDAGLRTGAANLDYSAWDYNLGEGWLCLQDAMRYLKATDQRTRDLIELRYVCNTNVLFVDGPNHKIHKVYGRQMSGYDDTTLGNTTAQRVISRYCAMKASRDYTKQVSDPNDGHCIIAVGDDVCLLINWEDVPRFVRIANDVCKVVIHEDEKHAKGVMFIQWRAFRENGETRIAYNWPRVLRSMLSKEDAKGLGRGGWTLAFYQQLGKLLQVPDRGLNVVVSITAACDQHHLSLDVPVGEILSWVKAEDEARVKTSATNRSAKMLRKNTTAERLYNGNPNLPGVKEGPNGLEIDGAYFQRVQEKLRSVYDPHFLSRIGLKNPDLSKVHFD